MSREALVVGINRYPVLKDPKTKKPKHLSLPATDAEAVAQMLETHGKFRVRRMPDTFTDGAWRVNENPPPMKLTKMTHLERAIELLFNPPSDVPDTALLYFAGHGLIKERGGVREGFLATSDANGKSKWGVSFHWLRQVLQKSPVRQKLVWLDCCHSGGLLNNFDEADPGAKGTKGDICLIAASREFEVAYEGLGDDHGVLTGTLLAALNPENHQTSWVTNYDVVDYITSSLATTPQRPVHRNFGGEIVITGQKKQLLQATLMAGVCPYKGLEAFDFNDEDPKYFFGRTALVDELLDRLREGKFLAVVGASGSGKSSVVKAGLLHQLQLGRRLSGSEEWQILIFRPGEHPLENLTLAFGGAPDKLRLRDGKGLAQLVRTSGHAGVVLVADQFEEAFTLCEDDAERQLFFACLLGALEERHTNLRVIITMRADFFGKCAEREYSGLQGKIQEHLVTVRPMNPAELTEAILGPALEVGLEVQRELVEQMLSDVEGPGSLPLLQYTLWELWHHREVNRFTLAEYTRLGGIKKTLPKRAEEIYQSLDGEQQLAAKRIFLELMHLGEGTEDTRRQILKRDLINEYQSEPLIDATLDKFVEARLLVTSELLRRGSAENTVTAVDVAHEALIRNWSRLQAWVEENRETIAIERKIESEASEWLRSGKSADYLRSGAPLVEAQSYLENYGYLGLLSDLGKQYIEKSLQGQRRHRRLLVGTGVLVLSIVSGLAIFSTFQWQKASEQTKIAREQTTLAQMRADAATAKNLLRADPVKALTLAIKTTGLNLEQSQQIQPQVQSILRSAIAKARERNLFPGHAGYIRSVAFSPDGQMIVSASDDRTLRLWDLRGNSIGRPFRGHESKVFSVGFSPDSKYIVSGSEDRTLRLWDLQGHPIGQPFRGHEGAVFSVAFSPDGKYIFSGSEDRTLRLWDLQGHPIGQPFRGHEGAVFSVDISPDGKYIISGSEDNTLRLWDLQGNPIGEAFRGHEGEVFSVAFSPDGKYILSGSEDHTLRLWDLQGHPIGKPFYGHESEVFFSVAFSPDGKDIVSVGDEKTLQLWDLQGNPIGEPFRGHESYVRAVAFSPDNKYIVSGSSDRTLRLWDIESNSIGDPFLGHESHVRAVAFSPDNKYIVSSSSDNTIRLWDIKGNPIGEPFRGHERDVRAVALSPNGKYIVSASDDKTLRLWDIRGRPIGEPFRGHERDVRAVAFSPDGKYIVSGSKDKTLRLWDLQGNSLGEAFRGHKNYVRAVAFSPDGKYIVSGSYDKTLRLWDFHGNPIGEAFRGHQNAVNSVAFSPDGKYIISGSSDNELRLWDRQGNPIGEPFHGHESYIRTVAFSPNGQMIVSGSADKTLRLWDIQGNPIGEPFRGHGSQIYSVAFSPDGKYIVSGSRDKTLRLWRGEQWPDWLAVACDKLQFHPVLAGPEPDAIAKAAVKTCQKYVWNDRENAQFLMKQGRLLAREKGDVSGAFAKFKAARHLDDTLDLQALQEEAKQLAAARRIDRGEKLVRDGKIKEGHLD